MRQVKIECVRSKLDFHNKYGVSAHERIDDDLFVIFRIGLVDSHFVAADQSAVCRIVSRERIRTVRTDVAVSRLPR